MNTKSFTIGLLKEQHEYSGDHFLMSKVTEWNIKLLQNFLSASEWFNFELTNYCNIPCIYCDNKNLGNKGYMTIDSFKVIVSKLFNGENKQKNVIFCGYGEPFLNSEIYDMIDFICDKGIELTIQTNGKWQLNETMNREPV